MAQQQIDLADLLTASGRAMATANLRLAAKGEPALLQSFTVEVNFPGTVSVAAGACGLCLTRPAANLLLMPLAQTNAASVAIAATYIAAPSTPPSVGPGGVCDP